jgi:uncharacterized protein YndB with AHSA1/START domain
MITVEKSIVIGRPAEDVFAYVSDQTNAPLWQRGLLEVRRTTDGPIGVGTRHTVVRTLMGLRLELSNEYTRYEPNRLVTFEWSGTMLGRASYVVDRQARTRQAHLPDRDAGARPIPPRGAADGGEAEKRRGGQPRQAEGPARSQSGRRLGPRPSAGLSAVQSTTRAAG